MTCGFCLDLCQVTWVICHQGGAGSEVGLLLGSVPGYLGHLTLMALSERCMLEIDLSQVAGVTNDQGKRQGKLVGPSRKQEDKCPR